MQSETEFEKIIDHFNWNNNNRTTINTVGKYTHCVSKKTKLMKTKMNGRKLYRFHLFSVDNEAYLPARFPVQRTWLRDYQAWDSGDQEGNDTYDWPETQRLFRLLFCKYLPFHRLATRKYKNKDVSRTFCTSFHVPSAITSNCDKYNSEKIYVRTVTTE